MPTRAIKRIASVETVLPLSLVVTFDDGRKVLYDVAEDVDVIPAFEPLRSEPGLFCSVQLDQSGTCLYWDDMIDLPSDAIYEYGTPLN